MQIVIIPYWNDPFSCHATGRSTIILVWIQTSMQFQTNASQMPSSSVTDRIRWQLYALILYVLGGKKNPSTQLISGVRSHTAKPLGSHAGQTVRGRCNVCAARNRLRNMACFFCCCFPCRCRVCACVSKLNIHMHHHHARLQQIQANRSVPVMYLRRRNNLFGSANGTTERVMR